MISAGLDEGERAAPVFERAVAAVDGTPASFRAAALAAALAAAGGGTVDLIAVIEPRGARLPFGGPDFEEQRTRKEADLRSAVASLGTAAAVRHLRVESGPVAERVLAFASEMKAELICVGAGRHRFALGSVSAELVRRSEVAVLVVREGVSGGPRIHRILVGIDGSEGALHAAAAAGRIGGLCKAEVTCVWVLAPSWPMSKAGLDLADDEVQRLAGAPEREELDRAMEAARAAGAGEVSGLFELGAPADRLLARAQAWDTDLVVVGARGRTAGHRFLLGGTSDRVAARSERPVLVIR